MIQNPLFIVLILLFIEIAVLFLASRNQFKKYFQFLPSVFWIYFLPMLISTLGIIDAKSPIYQVISNYFLPTSLLLLLIPIDIKSILRLGKEALLTFFIGSLGMMVGTITVFSLFRQRLGDDFWAGFACLSASWTGGSANMIAVKEALGTPDSIFLPMVVVDTIVPYVWMAILVGVSSFQMFYDRWNQSENKILQQWKQKGSSLSSSHRLKLKIVPTFFILCIGFMGASFAKLAAGFLPMIKDVISPYAWTIILVSILGILLSLTPLRKLENYGVSRIGYFILYFVLTSIGAKANLSQLGSTFLLIMAGFLIVFIHAVILLLFSRIFKIPMFLVAVASQANIGGVASAPVVAEIYQPGLASVGLLLAILGNIVGTYFGIVSGQLCYFLTKI